MFIETWGGRFERSQDIVYSAMDRTGDKVYEYLEWSIEHLEFVKTVSCSICWCCSVLMLPLQLRVAKAAATAYEMLLDYSEEAVDQLKALNPLKEKKINLLTDSDDDEEEVYYHDNE